MVQDFFGENEKSVIDWTVVDQYQKEGTRSGLIMALVECDKLLSHMMHLKGYRGKTIYERIASAKDAIHDIGGLAYALEVKENIITEFDKEVSDKEIARAIEKYKDTIRDIETSQVPESGFIDSFKRNLDYYFISKPEQFRKIVLWFLAVVLGIIVLDNTHIGQTIAHGISRLFTGIISWVFVVAIILGIILIIASSAVMMSRAKKEQKEQGKIDLPDANLKNKN